VDHTLVFDAPLEVEQGTSTVLELFMPTLAFKDFCAAFLFQVDEYCSFANQTQSSCVGAILGTQELRLQMDFWSGWSRGDILFQREV